MHNPELVQKVTLNMPTGRRSMRVLAITRHFIMVDIIRGTRVEIPNVIIARNTFEWIFLKHPLWSCYKKYTNNPRSHSLAHTSENPPRATTGEEDGTFNPSVSMAQANRYIGMNKYLVNCVY